MQAVNKLSSCVSNKSYIRDVPNRDDFVKLAPQMAVDNRLDLLAQELGFVPNSITREEGIFGVAT